MATTHGNPAGLWWSDQGAPSRFHDNSPIERFINDVWLFNFLLYSEQVNDSDIEPEFATFLDENCIPRDTRLKFYRQTLPIEYNNLMKSLKWNRQLVTPKGTHTNVYKRRMVHNVHLDQQQLFNDSDVDFNSMLAREILSATFERPDQVAYQELLKQHIDARTLIPCASDAIDTRFNKPRDLPDDDDMGVLLDYQMRYQEFMTPNPVPDERFEGKAGLYWVDLHAIHFKHAVIDNEGDINKEKKETYMITDNIAKVVAEPDFYTNLVKNSVAGLGVKAATPLGVFFMNGRLYSHDHKRIITNLAAGNRYLLGMLEYNPEKVIRREIGYHTQKGIFTSTDRSLIMTFTTEQLEKLPFNYFFVLDGGDLTPFMQTIASTTVEQRLKTLNVAKLQSYAFSQIPSDEFAILHSCYPNLFQSLDNPERLIRYYITKIDQATKSLQHLIGKIKTSSPPSSPVSKPTPPKPKVAKKPKPQIDTTEFREYFDHLESKTVDELTEIEQCALRTHHCTITKTRDAELDAKKRELLNDKDNKKEFREIMTKLFLGRPKSVKKKQSSIPKHTTLVDGAPRWSKNVTKILEDFGIDLEWSADKIIARFNWHLTDLQTQRDYLNSTKRTIRELLSWELEHFGNSMWYLLKVKHINPVIKRLIQTKYDFINKLPKPNNSRLYDTRGVIRYNKTGEFDLEDLVMVFRGASYNGIADVHDAAGEPIGIKQTYSAAEISAWQATKPEKYPYLATEKLAKSYNCDGILTEEVIERIMSKQKFDHQRIFVKLKDGIKVYGAYQGLVEAIPYTELMPCADEMHYCIHLTRQDIVGKILAGKPTGGTKTNPSPEPGHLELMGRYLHAFGWAEPHSDAFHLQHAVWDSVKTRLFHRFRNRVGLAVDMRVLKDYYSKIGVEWTQVCGINEINTVIFLKKVPPCAIIARGRTDETPGTPYNMEEMWDMKYDTVV